jgi:hypothetical protein
MLQVIVGYHTDEERHWVAKLQCGHFQHVRHQPPFINRPWVMSAAGRKAKLGYALACKKCDISAPKDSIL